MKDEPLSRGPGLGGAPGARRWIRSPARRSLGTMHATPARAVAMARLNARAAVRLACASNVGETGGDGLDCANAGAGGEVVSLSPPPPRQPMATRLTAECARSVTSWRCPWRPWATPLAMSRTWTVCGATTAPARCPNENLQGWPELRGLAQQFDCKSLSQP
jgi:hypothetical protein